MSKIPENDVGKNVLVTGASSGIGQAIARRLARWLAASARAARTRAASCS